MPQDKRIVLRRRRPGVVVRPTTPPTPPPQVNHEAPITHFLNDPTTPTLTKTSVIAKPANPVFVIKDFVGGNSTLGSPQDIAANVYATMCNTLNYFKTQTPNPITRWSSTGVLAVLPLAGVDLNAFYDRRSLQFFFYGDKRLNGTIISAYSGDVVSHELGHAILDFYRPDAWSGGSMEVWAFHECFGDFTALMNILTYDEILNHLINQTGGNLRVPNVVSNMAEQMGWAVSVLDPASGRNPAYLRSALNDFKYVDPGTLPENTPDNVLAAEPHNFSRIFLGALYDIFVVIYEDTVASGQSPIDSLKHSRDQLTQYVLRAIQNAPLNARFYESMAKTILWADATGNNRKYHDKMQGVFLNRNIITPQVGILSVRASNGETMVKTESKKLCKLSDHFLRIQSTNDLYDVDVEVLNDEAHMFDNEGNWLHSVVADEADALNMAQDMICYLHATKGVSQSSKTPFEIRNGKLTRTHFCCGG